MNHIKRGEENGETEEAEDNISLSWAHKICNGMFDLKLNIRSMELDGARLGPSQTADRHQHVESLTTSIKASVAQSIGHKTSHSSSIARTMNDRPIC